MLSIAFLQDFKRETEAKWNGKPIDSAVYGFQIQSGTRWNLGLPESAILDYELALGLSFSEDFRILLGFMNGTDVPTLNVFGSSGEASREAAGVYTYPRDLGLVQSGAASVSSRLYREVLTRTLAEEGFHLPTNASLVPFYAHRFVVCIPGEANSPVLSIWDETDAIVYGRSLQDYLKVEFLTGRA
jgi:hypothetical protein